MSAWETVGTYMGVGTEYAVEVSARGDRVRLTRASGPCFDVLSEEACVSPTDFAQAQERAALRMVAEALEELRAEYRVLDDPDGADGRYVLKP